MTTRLMLSLEWREDVHERLRSAVEGMNHPVKTARVNIVRATTLSVEKVPPNDRPELGGIREIQTP